MRQVWVRARKAFTFEGTPLQVGQPFEVPPLVAVRLVTSRLAVYHKPRRMDSEPVMAPTPEPTPEPKTHTRRVARRVALPADTRPEHPAVEALPPTPDAPAPNVTWKFEDY